MQDVREKKYALLRTYFGCASFRDGQEALIDAQLTVRDVLGVMPTGGGKSLCYQLPALLLRSRQGRSVRAAQEEFCVRLRKRRSSNEHFLLDFGRLLFLESARG